MRRLAWLSAGAVLLTSLSALGGELPSESEPNTLPVGTAETSSSGHDSAMKPVGSQPPSQVRSSLQARPSGRYLVEVLTDGVLLRDAYSAASQVERVVRGQQVMLVDFIDRRLRILNALVFDGGFWLKVRVADGREGWIPADAVRALR